MPSRKIKKSSENNDLKSSYHCRQPQSSIETLLGIDDSILESIGNDISVNNKRNSKGQVKELGVHTTVVGSQNHLEYCGQSQVVLSNPIQSPCYEDPIHDDEYQWHNETLFNEAVIDACLDDSSTESKTLETLGQSRRYVEPFDENSLEGRRNISQDQPLFTSDEICFDDFLLSLGEQDEFSILQQNSKLGDEPNCLANADKRIKSQSNEAESFYGLPLRVKTLIQETKKITSLYDWQDECLNLEAVKNRRNLIYALPTSGGKTLVAEILMLKEILCNKKNVLFVLPFVAIVQEKVQSMTQFALELGFLVEEYASGKGQYPPMKRRRKNSIYICTIEKAQGLVNSLIELKRLDEIGIVVVDELHLLGESGGRGATLEGLLTKLMFAGAGKIQIVGMSATIGNLNEVAHFMKADVYTQNFRPVEIKEYVKCDNKIWLLNLYDDPIFTDEKRINYRYSETANQIDPDRIGGLVMDVVPNDSCLVFCATRKNCESVALLLTRVMFSFVKDHKVKAKEELLEALKFEGELCPILAKTVKFGVAYHHSGLTSEERKLLEDAFKDGTLCVLCCTSTLAAGVNLPARRVILRRPYIGDQFLNLSRYKQMIGRAGRAGMGEIGESILVCNQGEMEKVQELLKSRMDDCISTLHLEEDRGINNLILSSVTLDIATTRSDLHKLVSSTLLGVQQNRLNVNVKTLVDNAITVLLKAAVLRVKRSGDFDPNITVGIESQIDNDVDYKPKVKKGKRNIILAANTIFEPTPLGRAAMKGSVDLKCAYTLYQDLKTAQMHMVLINDLHIMYLVTPYDMAEKMKPVGFVYYDVITSLPSTHMTTPRVLGINEVTITKMRDGLTPKGIEPRIINRFWLTLMLYELWQHRPLYIVAHRYQVDRGVIQNLLNAAATFANCVVRFCEELQEFWAFTDMLSTFSKKLNYCCTADLEPLMELPAVKVSRARQLFNAGYKTLQSIATANPNDLEEKIHNLPKKTIKRIIAAAKLLLMEKVENLRDEAAEVLEALNVSQFDWESDFSCKLNQQFD